MPAVSKQSSKMSTSIQNGSLEDTKATYISLYGEKKHQLPHKYLLYAVRNNHLHIVRWLIEEQKVQQAAKDAVTPLRAAVTHGHLELVQWLVSHGNSPNDEDDCGLNALHTAADNGHLSIVQWLHQECGMVIEVEDGEEPCVVHLAAEGGHLELLRWVHETAGCKLHNSLFMAALSAQVEVILWVLQVNGTLAEQEEAALRRIVKESKIANSSDVEQKTATSIAVLEWLIDQKGYQPEKIISIGLNFSLLCERNGVVKALSKWRIG
eukprot:TRINITY_DN67740_c1_g2_i3.p1 TRINITY_DN67740_c1_g2~~TRINITY_DN67740_c1_g2_i3.p1  ORF type:complete len:266 (+),score=24.91 TRINITY_DN67740_c1_g2_i3:53-850(+)